jgi:hypothetical protein
LALEWVDLGLGREEFGKIIEIGLGVECQNIKYH